MRVNPVMPNIQPRLTRHDGNSMTMPATISGNYSNIDSLPMGNVSNVMIRNRKRSPRKVFHILHSQGPEEI